MFVCFFFLVKDDYNPVSSNRKVKNLLGISNVENWTFSLPKEVSQEHRSFITIDERGFSFRRGNVEGSLCRSKDLGYVKMTGDGNNKNYGRINLYPSQTFGIVDLKILVGVFRQPKFPIVTTSRNYNRPEGNGVFSVKGRSSWCLHSLVGL